MLISTLNLEAKALKAFREDSETESDQEDDLNQRPNARSNARDGEIQLSEYQSRLSDGYTDGADSGRASKLQYMGGEKERSGKKRNKKD